MFLFFDINIQEQHLIKKKKNLEIISIFYKKNYNLNYKFSFMYGY